MTDFLFIRHGEASANVTPEYICGQSNHTPLTPLGEKQAAALGVYLQDAAITPTALFSSGAIRADTTAQIALEVAAITQPVIIDERLLEMGQGECEGLLRETVYTPENIEKYAITEPHGKFPGGESLLDVQARMLQFIEERSQQYPDGTVLAFGHGLAIRSLAGALRKLSKADILAEATGNVSVTHINTSDAGHTVRFVGKNVIERYT